MGARESSPQMAFQEPINCTKCACLAGDRCTFHDVELDNPAFTLCAHFRAPGEDPDTMVHQHPELQELSPDWIYEIDPTGEVLPLLQTARRRRQSTRGTGRLNMALYGLPEVAPAHAVDRADRFAGALLGLALGDALGFPAEGRSPAEVEMIYGGPVTGLVGRIGRRHRWPVGQVTKDTQLTMLLAESLVQEGGLDMDDWADRLVRWLPSGLRVGKSTIQAIEALQEGRHWSVSGLDSNGAGATVRVVPLALLRHTDYGKLRQEAILQCMPTHQAPKAYAGTVLFATAVGALVNTAHGQLKRAEFLQLLDRAIRGIDVEVNIRLHDVSAMLADGLTPAQAMARLKTGGYVLECLPSALYCFLYHAEQPEQAMVAAANGGFDANSVAAMVGAMAGAYHGRRGLPGAWVQELPVAQAIAELAAGLEKLAAAAVAAEAR
jgi:ADP-ribosylglycohydrolase